MTTPDTLSIRVNAHQFASAIRYVATAAAKDDARPVLAGVNLRICGGLLDVAAADGFRLHVATIQPKSLTATGASISDLVHNTIIDAQALLTWAKTVKAPRKAGSTYAPTYATLTIDTVSVAIDGVMLEKHDKLAIAAGQTLPTAVIDGTFPDYRQIIPATDEAHRFRFNAEYVRDAAKPYTRGKRDTNKLGIPRTILYTATDGFPHIGAAGFEMPDNTVGNGETADFAHVARFGPGTAESVLTLATVLNTNYLHDALSGVDHGATFQTASTNTAVRLDLWQTRYSYSTQLCAVIMPMVIGDYGVKPSNHRDLSAPDANAAPQSDETPAQDVEPMPAPESATTSPRCPVCSAIIEPGDKFCPMCGARLAPIAAEQAPEVTTWDANLHADPREHRCPRCTDKGYSGIGCAQCDATERTIARRAERAATLAATVAPDPEPADVLPYSGAADLSARYSQGNVLRILAACPTATDTRGFHQWQEAGRAVKKGEKGILIYTPAGTRTNDDGTERTMVRKAYVWDISQTEPIEAFRARQDAKKAAKDAPVLCADCGNPDADGLCSACAYVRKATTPAVATPYPSVQHMNPHVDRTPIRPAAPAPRPALRAADI